MRTVAFDGIAVSAKQLQVAYMVGSAFGAWNDMVNRQIAKLEMMLATVAVAALLAVEIPLVFRIVVRQNLP